MAHYIDTTFGGQAPSYSRLGKHLEEFNVELNPDTESFTNIIGETAFNFNGYDVSSDVDPYYADTEDPLFTKLQQFVDTRETGDALKTTVVEAHLWEDVDGGAVTAYRQEAYVVPQSYGGGTSGYGIPFNLTYVGERTAGTFDPSTKTFSASGAVGASN